MPLSLQQAERRDYALQMEVPGEKKVASRPNLPRRAFFAAGLSAALAFTCVSLAMIGGLSRTKGDSFQFTRGLSFASGEEARLRGLLAEALPDDRIHVTILGHTGDVGDASANLSLSEDRADLAKTLAEEMAISGNRISARGVGGAAPLPRLDGETARAYQSRLARVEVTLQMRR